MPHFELLHLVGRGKTQYAFVVIVMLLPVPYFARSLAFERHAVKAVDESVPDFVLQKKRFREVDHAHQRVPRLRQRKQMVELRHRLYGIHKANLKIKQSRCTTAYIGLQSIEQTHAEGVLRVSGIGAQRNDAFELVHFCGRQYDLRRRQVFFQIFPAFGSRNGYDALRHHQGQCELRRADAFACGHGFNGLNQFDVFVELRVLESGNGASEIVLRQIIQTFDLTG